VTLPKTGLSTVWTFGLLGVKLKFCWKKLFALIVINIAQWRNFEITIEATVEEGNPHSGLKNVTIIFSTSVQNSFESPNCYKIDQLMKELREKLNGWKEQLEGPGQICVFSIFLMFAA
jgi:hypothetical protein